MKIIITENQIRMLALTLSEADTPMSSVNPMVGYIESLAKIMSNTDDETTNISGPIGKEFIKNYVDNISTDTPLIPTVNRVLSHPLGDPNKFNISSGFNTMRGSRRHNSVDIAAPSGTPVYAPADGTVLTAGDIGGRCGGYIKIKHKKYHTKYCHLKGWNVRSGGQVKKGQLIGYVGGGKNDSYKGVATGSHLHYEILVNGTTHINPEQPIFGFI